MSPHVNALTSLQLLTYSWQERRKERKISLWPYIHVEYVQRFVSLNEYDHIKKMLTKVKNTKQEWQSNMFLII